MDRDWRRYAAPVGFLLAATIAVVLIHSGLQSGKSSGNPSTAVVTTTPRKHVATTTTTAHTKKTTAKRQYYTVLAGDTFGVISTKTGVPVATIEQLNPNVSSTSLFIGEKIRIK